MTDAHLSTPGPTTVPEPTAAAAAVFGDRLGSARAYAALLAGDGVEHGHIGPREVERLWTRHLVNSAVLTDLLPTDAHIVDVGSGAGLPGLAVAIRRPDVRVVLVEPMLRRTVFLQRAVDELELADQVTVLRGRAEDAAVVQSVSDSRFVVARAVAPLDRLMRWCLPLVAPGGRVLALKGESARTEVDLHRNAVRRAGGVEIEVLELPAPAVGDEPIDVTWVVSVQRDPAPRRKTKGRR